MTNTLPRSWNICSVCASCFLGIRSKHYAQKIKKTTQPYKLKKTCYRLLITFYYLTVAEVLRCELVSTWQNQLQSKHVPNYYSLNQDG